MKGFFCNACLRKACLIFLYGSFKSFLVACTRLYNLPCPLVGQSVSWSHCILFYDFISLTSLLLPKWCFFLSLASSFFFCVSKQNSFAVDCDGSILYSRKTISISRTVGQWARQCKKQSITGKVTAELRDGQTDGQMD